MRKRSRMRTTIVGGTSFANSVACLGFDPPFPARKTDVNQARGYEIHRGVRTIPSFVSCDQTKVLRLCFGTLSNATTHTTFDLVGRADALVPFFKVNSHCKCFVNSVNLHVHSRTYFRQNRRFRSGTRWFLRMTLQSVRPSLNNACMFNTTQI